MLSYLARLKQLESVENSSHAPDLEPAKAANAPYVGFVGMYPGANAEKINAITAEQENRIRIWMAREGETDAQIIGEYLDGCRHDPEALAYFLKRAEEVPATVSDDDRITCKQCLNLINQRCQAARRGEIASPGYQPVQDLFRRCEGYTPYSNDPDQRLGRIRWPNLLIKN